MFRYHQTNGEHGEICVERAGNFIGFIMNLGRAHQWAGSGNEISGGELDRGGRGRSCCSCGDTEADGLAHAAKAG
jgi:hypothetical protein